MESKYSQCSTNLAKTQSTITEKEVRKKVIETTIKKIEDQIYTINTHGYYCTTSAGGSSSCQNNMAEQEKWPIISQLETKKSELQLELLKIQ